MLRLFIWYNTNGMICARGKCRAGTRSPGISAKEISFKSKEQLQNSELRQVSGGRRRPRGGTGCAACGVENEKDYSYPNGYFLREEKDGCGYDYYYKCPVCGYEWKE